MTQRFRVSYQSVPPRPSWTAWKERSFGTLTIDGAEATFTPKNGNPVAISNVFKVTSGWRNQKFGEPILRALDTYVEVLYGDPEHPSVAFVNDGRLFGFGAYFKNSRLREALRSLLPDAQDQPRP